MSPRALAARRQALIARSAQQRARIALQLLPAQRVLGFADRVIGAVRAHPLAFTLGASLLALRSRRPVLALLTRALPLYSLLRR